MNNQFPERSKLVTKLSHYYVWPKMLLYFLLFKNFSIFGGEVTDNFDLLNYSVNSIGYIACIAFLFQVKVPPRNLWKIYAIVILTIEIATLSFIPIDVYWFITVAILIPYYVIVFHYAFKSEQIWKS